LQCLAQITQNLKTGFINLKGGIVIEPEFDHLFHGFEGDLALVGKGGNLFYINENGEKVVYTDTICSKKVIKNSKNEIIYPKNFKPKCETE
jgi:hypothetical protein